jgi:hypothetical protein
LKNKAKVPFGDLGVEANLEVFPKPSRFNGLQKKQAHEAYAGHVGRHDDRSNLTRLMQFILGRRRSNHPACLPYSPGRFLTSYL